MILIFMEGEGDEIKSKHASKRDRTLHLIPSSLVWAEIKSITHFALPKQPINQFKQVQQNRQQTL